MNSASPSRARRLDAQAVSALISQAETRGEADRTAALVVSEARDKAAAILRAARRRGRSLHDVTDETLANFVDRTKLQSAATASVEVLRTSARITARFDALGPWFEDLILSSVRQIIGSFEPEDLHGRIIADALTSGRRGWTVTIRAHPDIVDQIRAAVSTPTGEIADRFAAVDAVVADDTLDPCGCVLMSDSGALDVSLTTQFEMLRRRLLQSAQFQATGGTET